VKGQRQSPVSAESSERTLALWCPAWAVATACRADPSLTGVPLAVMERGPRGLVVRAASAEARAEGVTVGLRRREAEARCGGLVVVDADPAAEARTFEVVARAMESITPSVVLERPGVLTFPTRGPSRYFGGDDALCEQVLEAVGMHVVGARLGVADGVFAARLASRTAGATGRRVIALGASSEFLAPWPVNVLSSVVDGGDDLTGLLVRLGLPTLGDFAALPPSAVLARFGVDGARAHRLALGLGEHSAPPAAPPPDLVETHELDPPATRVDEAAFAAKGLADRLLSRLEGLGLACTQVVVEAETQHGERLSRCWRHEGALTPAALVARVRWQLDGWLAGRSGPEMEEATAGLVLVRLAPDRVVPATSRQLGFWGGDAAAHDRADRVLARLQGMLGHDAVVTAVVTGGRAPTERVRWVPWGEPRDDSIASGAEVPVWPGAVPGPPPARVHAPPLPAELLDADGGAVTVSGRGEPSASPARVMCDALPEGGGEVTSWAGPWAHDLRWWDRVARRRRALWQVVIGHGDRQVACLVAVERGRAGIEAVYD
jgi:protein ImuB